MKGEKEKSNNFVIIFFHMIKSAGTTFNYILRNNFGFNHVEVFTVADGGVDLWGRKYVGIEDINWFFKVNPGIRSLTGHFLRPFIPYGRVIKRPFFVTFLRNPIDRYISHFNHQARASKSPMTFDEWLESEHENNYQTRFLANEEDSKKAIWFIENFFDFVGIVEKFDLSLLLLRHKLDLDFDIRYRPVNVSAHKLIRKEHLDPKTLKRVERNNSFDLEVYSAALRRFKKELSGYNGDIEKDLHEFREDLNKFNFSTTKLWSYRIGKYLYYRPLGNIKRVLT